MDYEKKHKEALERAKEVYNRKDATDGGKLILESMFSELKESEDERIREEIVDYLKKFVPHCDDDLVAKSKVWIAWLEKQVRDLEPIPLTEEFFKKNGFVLDNSFYPYYKKYESEDQRIIITDETNSGDGYWYVHVDNEDFSSIGGCDVKYVYQFQQLLELCRYEMDVVM